MKRTVLLIALASLLALGGQSFAELCTIDAVPAATLLLPYFEVSLNSIPDDPVQAATNVDTFFSVNNASAAPTVAHVVFWGDWSLPSIDFDIFLTGYDVETVSLSDVFNNGNLPITAHAWADPADMISPHGRELDDPANASGPFPGNSENPSWDSYDPDLTPAGGDVGCDPQQDDPSMPGYCPRLLGCDANLPLGPNPTLTGAFLDRIRCGHTGRGLACGNTNCIGEVHDDGAGGNDWIARGYITIDNVTDCNLLFPNQAGYFGTGITKEINQLWGDWFIVQEGRAIGDNLVHIEADPSGGFGPGDYTFYGRYLTPPASGADQREPLGTTWATRYFNTAGNPAALFDGGTSLFVWRDSKCQVAVSGFAPVGGCSATSVTPPWYPLDETQVVAFDTQEDATQICTFVPGNPPGTGVSPPDPGSPPDPINCFPIETGRYRVGEGNLTPPYDFGWLYLNLNFTLGDTSGQVPPCSTDGLYGDIAQSYISTELDAEGGQFSVGFAAIELTSACTGTPNNNAVIMGDLGG